MLFAVMQRQSILYNKASFNFGKNSDGFDTRIPCILPSLLPDRIHVRSCFLRAEIPSSIKIESLDFTKIGCTFRQAEVRSVAYENEGELSDEDDELCPVDCVREFKTDEEFSRILEKAKETNSLVVVDFYRTSCGSCKYIEQGFAKLCKGSGDEEAAVIFLKHNVIDEYDEESEVAERLRIKAVPLFHFYKDGVLLESFPTRDKERIVAAILKYTSPASQDV
ncbi:thioredoxin-like 4, chloroplastic isoform X1 [Vitis riparia]|uniref:thioredoxin-like 4, chloroplastic isoform X1 n=1 Tax=Vitis riparia TaxID=96939 RepID=UPI00155B0591|nr:thioredoxin-like 4, chloroplastic isoform X1 [Vitis riparia]XP_034676672.1 thioredoxin-like 4, chloroplastic isoform X1 [Vitis riparia]XP_034676673.1 thioredoxin-like 4, chloroplastic isoform X1 [Vitis riparia]XP_034676674.1 thioredoxin-like 4, chloroplastic isoform X1 [Vitis riparia]XP_034676675.1 thioredoxin-like 4, chloroplastic isoform X1 [Vitis riparia]